MTINYKALIPLAMCVVLLGGCATTKLSEKQKKSLTSVSVSQVDVREDAYQEPNARKSTNAANAGGAAGGFIGSLIGSAIDASVMAHQQNEFREQYGDSFEAIEEMMPEDLSGVIKDRLLSIMRGDDFFQSRLVDEGENRLMAEVLNFGLRRHELATSDNMVMEFYLHTRIRLTNKDGSDIFTTFLTTSSSSNYLPNQYIEDKELIRKIVEECLLNFETSFKDFLDIKLGRES